MAGKRSGMKGIEHRCQETNKAVHRLTIVADNRDAGKVLFEIN